jgi:hypothetical protein
MTRAIKIKWKKRKERKPCKFGEVADNGAFEHAGSVCIKIDNDNGVLVSNLYDLIERRWSHLEDDDIVQPAKIRKISLQK